MKGRSGAIFALSVGVLLCCALAAGHEAGPTLAGDAVVLENGVCRYEIGLDGKNRAFADAGRRKDYCAPGQPFMMAAQGEKTWPSSRIELARDVLTVSFGDSGIQARVKAEVRRWYFLLSVEGVTGAQADWVQLCNLRLKITENVGTLVNAAWNDEFGACILACNDRTHSYGTGGNPAGLCVKCYREYGVDGAKAAVIGVPTGGPDPASRLLDAIEAVELEQGLPHPKIGGVWIKRAKERFASYLMAGAVSEQNIDRVIEFAKGGFGCVEIYPWQSTPTYKPNPALFPHGMAGLKKVADKIHAAGLQVGIHTMQGMVGWGSKQDPYISPKADPRLLQDRHASLATAVGPEAKELAVKEKLSDWPEKGDLYLEGEIVRYERRTDTQFLDCQRGMHKTTVTAHAEGAPVGHVVNCFKMWGSVVYSPDVKSTMIDEICDNMARAFNEVGADMAYFDGGEEVCVQPPHWHNQGKIALGVMKRLRKPVVLEGNALYTHLAWHVISRGSPSFDPIYFGRREYTLRFKGQNPVGWAKNLLTGDVGWFAPHVHSPSTYAVTPDEVMLLCLKALGGRSPISFSMGFTNPYANKRIPEMLEIIRACDQLKREEYFSEKVCAELTRPRAEHVLERTAAGGWAVSPMQFGPPRVLVARRAGSDEVRFQNPYAEQRPWLRLRACTRLAPYGAKENVVLADFGGAVPFKVADAAAPALVQSVSASSEKTPDGSSAFCYRAENKAKARSGWCRTSLEFPKTIDLSTHRRLGVWVKSEGKGGILNVQLAQGYGARDHYIPLDFKGWTYRALDPPEDARYYEYRWPYSMIDLMYWVFQYSSVKGINLYYNDLPPNAEVSCLIGRIEALCESPSPVKSPALEAGGQKMTFPGSLRPDEYIELDWTGKCRHFDPNGGLLADVNPQGTLRLAPGVNSVRFSGEGGEVASPRAELTLAVKGAALENQAKAARRPFRAEHPEDSEGLKLLPGGKGGFRLMQGLYELVGRETVQNVSVFDGKANAWTVENDQKTPCRGAVIIECAGSGVDADYNSPGGLLLEDFEDLRAYEMSERNQFEKYVIGGEKQIAPCGPVRAGVSQKFASSAEGAKAGRSCGVYSATNEGGAGGWCAKGKRFPEVLDLARYEAVALWVCGDGQRESLRLQFRDVTGKFADWLTPMDFTGWQLLVFRTADAKDFDWKKVEYVIFYYNGIPAKAAVTMKFDDLKALPKLRKAPKLSEPVLSVNGKPVEFHVSLHPGESLTTDGLGGCTVWEAGMKVRKRRHVPDSAFVLQPGPNRFDLSCDAGNGVPREVVCRVLRLGPAE